MLKVETEILADRQAKMTVEVEQDRLNKELLAAARRISGKANIPGFRRGKAPYSVIQRYFGDEAIFDEALEPLGQMVYTEALGDSGLEPYAPGSLDDVKRDPLVFEFSIPLVPDVNLGDYRGIRVKYVARKVTDHDVDHALEHAQDDQSTLEPVERAIELNDVASLDIKGVFVDTPAKKGKKKSEADPESSEAGENAFIDRKGARVLISQSASYPVPGFPDQVVGMSVKEQRSFNIAVSGKGDDIPEELRGRTIHFDVTCNEVFKREVPLLDDEFARSLGEYESLDDLKQKMREQLEKNAQDDSRNEFLDKVFEKLLDGVVTVSYPSVVIEEQIDKMVNDFDSSLRRQGMNLDDYLKMNSLSKDDLRKDFRTSAIQQVERGLVLGRISEAEQIEVTPEEVNDEVQTRLLSFGSQASIAKPLFDNPSVRQSIANRFLTDKTIDRLILIARAEAPELPEVTDSGAAKSKPSRKTGKKPKAAKVAK